MLSVKEIFYSIQGEGHNSGRPAVFVRFAGCNGWSGREEDRGNGPFPCSRWCDTDFVGGRKMSESDVLNEMERLWPKAWGYKFVVFTGGEPGLQLTDSIMDSVRRAGWSAAVETNGTVALPEGVYWKTVSPKTPIDALVVRSGHELKVIYPAIDPKPFEQLDFRYFYVQPLDDGYKNGLYMGDCFRFCSQRPRWRISLQTHKLIGVR